MSGRGYAIELSLLTLGVPYCNAFRWIGWTYCLFELLLDPVMP